MKLSDYQSGLPVYVTHSQSKYGVTVGKVFSTGKSKETVYKCQVQLVNGGVQTIPIRRLEIRQGVAA